MKLRQAIKIERRIRDWGCGGVNPHYRYSTCDKSLRVCQRHWRDKRVLVTWRLFQGNGWRGDRPDQNPDPSET